MNEKRLPPRLMVLLVVLKGEERWTNVQGTLFRTYGEFNNKRGFILANSPITLIIERQPNPLPFIACTYPQPP